MLIFVLCESVIVIAYLSLKMIPNSKKYDLGTTMQNNSKCLGATNIQCRRLVEDTAGLSIVPSVMMPSSLAL